MGLQHLLELSGNKKKIGLSEERVLAIVPEARKYIAFWREYPDLFVDFLCTGGREDVNTKFKFYFYQRIFLRAAMRYKYAYMVFPRAYSKSFLAVMILMCQCILYPGAKLFVTSGGKEQAASIIKEKVNEIEQLIPAFSKELDRRRGKTQEGKDYCRYVFKNGSYFDNIAARESSRGKRRHAGLVEECVGVDGDILQQVIIPTMNVSRQCKDGTTHEEESLNKSQIFVTTAGYKNTYPYDKHIQTLVQMALTPEKAIVMGGSWRIPVLMGLQDKSFIQDLQQDGTFNDASFAREYESQWSGSVENAFFSSEAFDRNRIILQPEYEYSKRSSEQSYYILSMDVGRKGCDSVICVFKVKPQSAGMAIKSLVNIYTIPDTHFEEQAIIAKRLFYKYKARRLILDANGLGIGLVDYMVKSQEDKSTGEYFPDFGIENDEEGFYKKYRTNETEFDALYLLKANAPINTEAHANLQVQLTSGKLKFLIDERVAKNKLLGTKLGQQMRPEERAKYLKPFTLTSILREELLNLREENEGVNIILKQANRAIRKDKVSALEYGLYYIKQEEDSQKRKKRFRASDFLFLN